MNMIVAVDPNWNIGYKGDLLVRIPADLKNFKEKTLNKVVVMGRKTFESLPSKSPLPNRTNIVLTKQKNFIPIGAVICNSYESLFSILKPYPLDNIFIIGGGEIYKELLPFCKLAYITKFSKVFPADTSIFNLDILPDWDVVDTDGPYLYKDDLSYTYCIYRNNRVSALS